MEANDVSLLTEALTADVQAVLADKTTLVTTDTANNMLVEICSRRQGVRSITSITSKSVVKCAIKRSRIREVTVSPEHSLDRKGLARTTPRIKSECDHSLWSSCATRHVTMYSLLAKYLIIKPETYQLREPLPKLRFQYVRHYSDSAMHVVIRTGREYQTF